jgi:23S rRNA pseudouridine1911/1915/1917 synthase
MKAVVPDTLDGTRVDAVVARIGGLSRSAARALVDAGEVLADGQAVAASQRLKAGAVVEFEVPAAREPLAPEAISFPVLYEDRHLAVVDKPTGIVTHPGAGADRGTLAAGLLHRWPAIRGVGDEGRWGIVHRLDKETSGALVVALDAEAFSGLRSAIQHRQVGRRYLTLVHGVPSTPLGTVEAPLGPDPTRRGRRRVDPRGKQARTHYRLLASASGLSLLEVTLDTGRTHQIRVHLAAVGLPVAGDRVYGRASGSPRMFLHSAALAFDHPITGDAIAVDCPLPDDLTTVLAESGIDH